MASVRPAYTLASVSLITIGLSDRSLMVVWRYPGCCCAAPSCDAGCPLPESPFANVIRVRARSYGRPKNTITVGGPFRDAVTSSQLAAGDNPKAVLHNSAGLSMVIDYHSFLSFLIYILLTTCLYLNVNGFEYLPHSQP